MTIQPGSRIETKAHLRAVPDAGVATPARREFAPPRFPPDLVGLGEQGRWLDRLARHEVALVQAPPGYGKSAWCAALFAEALDTGWRASWLSVDTDEGDGDVAALLAEALGTEIVTGDAPSSAIAAALAAHIDAEARPFLFILDDADRLIDPRALDILARLMRRAPTQLRLLLSGRMPPQIATGDAEARGMLLSIGRPELRLADGDVQRFLGQAGVTLSARDAGALNDFIEGWPAAMRLLAQHPDATARLAAAGDWSAIAEQVEPLIRSWIAPLSAPQRAALSRSAVASWIDPELYGLLSGGKDGAAIVRDLSVRGMLADRIGHGRGHRLHHALRAFLARAIGGAEAEQLHRIAARHFANRGMIADAIDQWLACGDVAEAAALMSTIAMPMVAEGALDRLADWLDRLPLAQIVAVPELARARMWLSLLRAEAPDAVILPAGAEGECLSLLRRVYGDDCSEKAVEACNGLLSEPRHLPDFAADMVRTAIAQGALRRGLFGLVHEAIRPVMLRRRGTASDLAGALAICAKAGAARAQGQLGEAERVLREAKMQQSRSGLAAALVDAALARAYYERDALDAAAELANGALPHLERSLFQDAIIPAYLVAIRIAAGRGQGDAAASLIDRAELIAFERDWAPLKALCVVERARLRLPSTIDPESVVAVGDEEAAVRDPLSASGRAFALLAEMRAYEAIANGDRSRLTLLADRLLHLAANGDDAELRAAATLFNILPQLSGRCDKMVELETVRFLNHAAASGFRRTIVDVLDVTGVRAVQNFCSEAYASDCFLALLKLAEPSRRNPALEGAHRAAPGEAFSFLTEREIEILSALNAGESNKEIARTLHLAPETVKWHLKNVMRKLRATSREEAVANAATLGLKLIEARAVS